MSRNSFVPDPRLPHAEPTWVSCTQVGSAYEVEMNVNARPGSPEAVTYRHRVLMPSGGSMGAWVAGRPAAGDRGLRR